MRYSIGGRTANTAATQDHAAVGLWNPHATIPLFLKEIRYYTVAATLSVHAFYKALTIGTPASAIVVQAHNCWGMNKKTPASVAALQIGPFTAQQPTYVSTPVAIMRQQVPAVAGAGYVWTFGDIRESDQTGYIVEPGCGAYVCTPVSTILQAGDFMFIWDEFEKWEEIDAH